MATARHAIREGKVDLVGMTRAHLADPHIVRKIIAGREAEIRPCVGATYCLDRIYEPARRCASTTRPPAASRRCRTRSRRAERARRVVVVGAGPGGLEAARVAGERGHDVVVLEAMPWAGGQIELAARNPAAATSSASSSGASASCERLGVDIRYDMLADAGDVTAAGARRGDRGDRRSAAAARAGGRRRAGS